MPGFLERVKVAEEGVRSNGGAAYLPGNYCGPREARQVIEAAGRLMDQTFVFTDPWDMEPAGEPVRLSGNAVGRGA